MDALADDRILITGATGFIGSALTEYLEGRGLTVAGLSRSIPPDARARRFAVDLNDSDAVFAAVKAFRPTLCYHLAAHPDAAESHAHSTRVIGTNLMGTLNLLEALRREGPCRVVYGCSVKVYGNGHVPYVADQAATPNSSYAVAKAAARELIELYRRLYAVPSVTLRPTVVFGPGQPRNIFRVVAQKLAGGEVRMDLMGGQQTRSPVYVDDVLEAFALAGERLAAGNALDGRTIPIGGDEELAVVDLVKRMARLAGRPLVPVLIESDMRPTEIFRSAADNAEAARLLGWHPRTSLDEGLRATLRAEGALPEDATAAPMAAAIPTPRFRGETVR